MKESGKIRRLYAGGNTAQGFYGFYNEIIKTMDKIFIVKGGPGSGKSTLIRRLSLAMADRGFDVELLCCPADNDSLDGAIFPAIKVALLDGTSPHLQDSNFAENVEVLDLGQLCNKEILNEHLEVINQCNTLINESFSKAHQHLKEAKEFYDQWRYSIMEQVDPLKLESIAQDFIAKIFTKKPVTRHFFASAITPEGIVNYINNITQGVKKRFIVKGMPGTGKSNLINRIAVTATAGAYDIDVYHCSFDPESFDMVIIPELSTAVIDGTPPHFVYGQREGDEVIEMMDYVAKGNFKDNSGLEMEEQFKQQLELAVNVLAKAKKLQDRIETYYIEAMDFEALDTWRQRVFNKILAIADKLR